MTATPTDIGRIDFAPARGDADHRARRRAALLIALLLALFAAATLNSFRAVLRFDDPVANYVAYAITATFPWVALVLGRSAIRGRWYWIYAAALTPVLLYTFPQTTCATMSAEDAASRGSDFSFEPVRALQLGSSRVRVYRTNCGATCDFGVVVRQERTLIPGVLLVRDLGHWYPAYDATLRPAPGGVRVDVTYPERAVADGHGSVAVRPWVYF